jgi:serine/threonine protein kinase/predicted esterase
MSVSAADVQAIFGRALELAVPAERAQYIASECGDNAALRAEVESLLLSYDRAENFLETAGPSRDQAANHMPVHEGAGSVIGPYKLLQQIGEGGFGVVYMAQQMEPIKRRVALKIIKPGMDSRQVVARFEAERQALAMMDHPNIARVLDAGTTVDRSLRERDGSRSEPTTVVESGRPYFVMELVKGVPITRFCDEHQLTIRQRLELFTQVCQGVQHAHHKGVIHRDIKPSNILVAEYDDRPVPKVIDFGVAKALNQLLTDKTMFTQFGQLVGTLDYMSPEQAKLNQLDVDTRSDIYSLGVVLYELLTGTTPVDKQRLQSAAFDEVLRIIAEEEAPTPSTRVSMHDTLPAIAASRSIEPAKLSSVLRGDLDWIVMKALEKDRNRRYETASSFAMDVQRYLADEPVQACPPSVGYRFRKFARRNSTILTAAALIAIALVVGTGVSTWQAWRATQAGIAAREDRDRALAAEAKEKAHGRILAIEAHIKAHQYEQAFELLQEVEAILPDDPRLTQLRTECSWVLTIESELAGVTVMRKPPEGSENSWKRLGVTPINKRRLARGVYHWTFAKRGYATAEGLAAEAPLGPAIAPMGGKIRVELDPENVVPPGMVRVDPLAPGFFWKGIDVAIPPFWMDRFEVTNRQFKRFVDEGGYRRKELWEHPFEKDGQAVSWEDAMALFRDTTGRPGPATWVEGSYPAGQDQFPVSGVSWYEAAAFARFAGKSLPTIYHWSGASGRIFVAGEIIARSNVEGTGPAEVGRYRGMSPKGIYDMAGNVKEWCWNSAGDGERYILGGAWDEPDYMFTLQDLRAAIDREKNMGFRCVKYMPAEVPPPLAFDENKPAVRDFLAEKLLTDDEFKVLKGYYAYDKSKPLNAVVEREEEEADWIHERVEFYAAYNDESVIVHLFLPTSAAPPYQPVIYWPGGGAKYAAGIASPTAQNLVFIIRSGRALVWPIYRGTYERKVNPPDRVSPNEPETQWQWEYSIQQTQDLSRTIDYLETRGDFNTKAIGYYGFSWGAIHAVRAVAVEGRIKAAVFTDGGLLPKSFGPPERDPVQYLPRITIPVLMLNGKYDASLPPKQSQEPMFRLLGTDAAHKRYRVFDVGHVSTTSDARIEETVSWFDRYLGSVVEKVNKSRR